MKQWYSVRELICLRGMPKTRRGVQMQAIEEEWQVRKSPRNPRQYEYHLSSLPADTQELLRDWYRAKQIPHDDIDEASQAFLQLTDKQRHKANDKAELLRQVEQFVEGEGLALMDALSEVALISGYSVRTLQRWRASVANIPAQHYAPFLHDYRGGSRGTSKLDEELFQIYASNYLRPEKPSHVSSYRYAVRVAKDRNVYIPSLSVFKRHLKKRFTRQQILLKRDGESALVRSLPAQRRTVANLDALQWINGDGYQHNVFVRWPNGKIERPKTWVWQDVYSRKILAYRVDVTENTDMLRLSFGDLVDEYGLPKNVTIDNTRAAANKVMTGGIKNRYRFKVQEDEAAGIFKTLGVQVHWTSIIGGKGHGQAKPVERAFGIGGIGDIVDKHPRFAGAYTGRNPQAKPDNYGNKAIELDEFLAVLAEGVREFNSIEGRQTEMAQGVYSYDQVFYESYQNAVIAKATEAQRLIWMLAPETVTVRQDGTVSLKAGKSNFGRNRYSAIELAEYVGRKVVVRYDPSDLHKDVYIYSLDGAVICTAELFDDVGFGDTHTARNFNRARRDLVKATKASAEAELNMSILEVSKSLTKVQPNEKIDAKIVRPVNVDIEMPTQNKTKEPAINEDLHSVVTNELLERRIEKHEELDPQARWDGWHLLKQAVEKSIELNTRQQAFYKTYPNTTEFSSMQMIADDFGYTEPKWNGKKEELIYA